MWGCLPLISLLAVYLLSSLHSTSAVVNPHNFTYILNTDKVCSQPQIDILIWVHSGPANIRRRIAIRETWANRLHMPKPYISRMIFFTGKVKNEKLMTALAYESAQYHDIVQEDYMDSYRNLTYKAMSGLKWIHYHCKKTNIKMILKTDDDMMIYTEKLFKHISKLTSFPNKPVTNTLICDVWQNRNVERSPGMKWTISKKEFSRDRYPTYCPGLALLMTPDLVNKLWAKALLTPYFWVDDVFFTGLLVEHLNISWIQTGSLFHFGGNRLPAQFLQQDSDFIFGHVFGYRNDLFYYLWRKVMPSQDMIN